MSKHTSDRLPSRCLIHLEGLEWFLYNRSPAFDAIVDRMKAANESANSPDSQTKGSSSSDDDTNAALARSDSDSNEVADQPKPMEEKVPGTSNDTDTRRPAVLIF
jgi:hypothetical protein